MIAPNGPPALVAPRLDFCEALLSAATAYGIAGCWQWKPLLDGKQVGGGGVGREG